MSATARTPAIEPLLSVSDVAEILGVAKATVYQLVKDGRLATVDIGIRKTRFRRSDIAALVEGRPKPPRSAGSD
jgi:excisionase family DNA binding protein